MTKASILAATLAAASTQAAEFIYDQQLTLASAILLGGIDDEIGSFAGGGISPTVGPVNLVNQGSPSASFGSLVYDQSLVTTIASQQFTANGSSDATFTELEGSRGGAAGFQITIWFSVDATTSFETSADFGISSAAGESGFTYTLTELGADNVFKFGQSTATVGDSSFNFSGILRKDRIYALQFGVNAFDTAQNVGTLDFRLTATPIPEPSTYAALAGVGLLAFGVWRRASNRATLTP